MSLKKLTAVLVVSLSLLFTAGCASSKKKGGADGSTSSSMTDQDQGSDGMSFELNADSDSGKAGALQTVFFGYDSSSLSSDAKSALKANAEFLKSNSAVEVLIEGHCDERGGVQYNIALGERRAKAVKSYLRAMGVPSSRMTVVSYGKERPLSFGHDASAWSQNRRANFVVTAK